MFLDGMERDREEKERRRKDALSQARYGCKYGDLLCGRKKAAIEETYAEEKAEEERRLARRKSYEQERRSSDKAANA
ncbi:MAG: hypothetical protein WC565_00165 [Parcubacteria group bacterium]